MLQFKLGSAAAKVAVISWPRCGLSCTCVVLQCAINTLADYYVEGPYTVPPAARSALATTFVSSGNLTLSDYITRSQARITVSLPVSPQSPLLPISCALPLATPRLMPSSAFAPHPPPPLSGPPMQLFILLQTPHLPSAHCLCSLPAVFRAAFHPSNQTHIMCIRQQLDQSRHLLHPGHSILTNM